MGETKTYKGGCHCGKVSYEVRSDLGMVVECNCSICSKRGSLLTFVPPDAMSIKSGADHVTDYQFHKHNIHHTFCKTCGILSYGNGTAPDGNPMYAVNVRCLEGVDIGALKLTQFDGKKL